MSCSHESVPLVFGPPGVWLQTLLLKHNRRVKQRQQNLIAAGKEALPAPVIPHWIGLDWSPHSQLPEPGTDEPSNQLLRYITTSTPTLSTTLRLNWQNFIATFQCCSPCLIHCFASRQALLQSREFSRRAVLLCQLAGHACLMLC